MATIAQRNVLIRFNTDARKARRDIQGVGKDVKGLSGLAQQAAGTFAGLFAFDIAQSTIQGITSFAKGAGQAAISFEQTQVAFETFLGSAAKASQVLAELQEFSTLTPFEPEQVISAGQALLAFGVNAEDLTSTLGKLGDISAGTGTDFNELAQIFGKAKVQGRLFGEDINQLTGRGIPIIAEFAKQFGVAQSEVKKLVSEGKIGFPELEKAFTSLTSEGGKFFELTAKQSQTVGGRISTLVGNFRELQKEIGQNLLPAISNVVDNFNKYVTVLRRINQQDPAEQIEDQRVELIKLTTSLQDVNLGEDERLKIINQLQKTYPGFLKNINAEKISNEKLLPILRDINGALIEKAVLVAKDAEIQKIAAAAGNTAARAAQLRLNIEDKLAEGQAQLNFNLDLSNLSFEEQVQKLLDTQKALLDYRRELRGVEVGTTEFNFINDKYINQLGLIESGIDDSAIRTQGLTKDYIEFGKATLGLSAEFIDYIDLQNETNALTGDQAKAQAELDAAYKDVSESVGKLNEGTEGYTGALNENTGATDANTKEQEKRAKQLAALAEQQRKFSEDVQKDARRNAEEVAKQIESEADQKKKADEEERRRRDQITETQREIEKERLRIVEETARQELERTNSIDQEQAALKQKAREESIKAEQEALDLITQSNQAAANAINEIGQALFGDQIKRLDEQIAAQQDAVNEALETVERGGAEQVQLEENRLAELQDQRERAAQNLRVVTAIEVAANQAAAVSAGIRAVTEAFAKSTVEGVIASVALAATVASSSIAIRNAFTDIPGFATGTEYFEGEGTGTSDSNIARISKGERIVPAGMNAAYFDTLNEFQHGTPMADLLHGIASGSIPMPIVSSDRQAGSRGGDNGEMLSEMRMMRKGLSRLEMNVTLDKNGFAASMKKYSEKKSKFRRKIS